MPAFIGLLALGVLNNGMDLLGVPTYTQIAVRALILVAIVAIDAVANGLRTATSPRRRSPSEEEAIARIVRIATTSLATLRGLRSALQPHPPRPAPTSPARSPAPLLDAAGALKGSSRVPAQRTFITLELFHDKPKARAIAEAVRRAVLQGAG